MSVPRLAVALAAFAAALGLLPAQSYAPPPVAAPDEVTKKEIANRAEKLDQRLGQLERRGLKDPILADVAVYAKAARWIVRHNEFYGEKAGAWTLAVLEDGLLRSAQAAQGEAPWLAHTGASVSRAYRSAVDGSVQPYAVTLPAEYGKDQARVWPVEVVLHGRDTSLTEVKFLHEHAGDRPAPKDQDWVQIDVFGRGNNAYRWAGESDVLEALAHFVAVERSLGRDKLLDLSRVVLRGFSMGGAGTWHIGLRRPDKWCAISPGAGFTKTRGYVAGLPEKLPPYQEACLHIYDAVDYAGNVFDVPVVAYSGEKDKQKAAADNIEARLKPLGLSMTHVVAPGLEHQLPPEWRKKVDAELAKYLEKGRPEYPKQVRFVTYSLKAAGCDWVSLMALEHHYEKASVDAELTADGFQIKTANVRLMNLKLPAGSVGNPVIAIDSQKIEAAPYVTSQGGRFVYLQRRAGQWSAVLPEKLFTDQGRRPYKAPDLAGPIDDAFASNFLCVHGTGKPWHAATQKYADDNLRRFQAEWGKYLRGELPVKDDVDVTPDDIANRSLVLFGDPASNSLIGQVLDALPLEWTKERIVLAGQTVSAADHVPVLIYPSPLNPRRYVVLNSGHTFHAADFQGTNALLYPRLGDYALLKPGLTQKDELAAEVVTAGLFDDFWQVKK
jgi:pimeloyl-ACP methyl ester carboxylesterase